MSKERESYIRRISAFTQDTDIRKECLVQYDEKEKLQMRLAEYGKSLDAQTVLYREMEKMHREDVRKMAECEKRESAAVRKMEEMSLAVKELRTCHAEAVQEQDRLRRENEALRSENLLLKDEKETLTGQLIEAVNSGKRMQERLEEKEEENHQMRDRIRRLQEQIGLSNKDRFGATTEKTSKIFDENTEEDPLREDVEELSGEEVDGQAEQDCKKDAAGEQGTGYSAALALELLEKALCGKEEKEGEKPKNKKTEKEKKPWKRSGIYDGISDHVDYYNYDFDELDRLYGAGNYRIISFTEKRTIRETRPHNYVYHEYKPVIQTWDDSGEGLICYERCDTNLYPHSFLSDSLFASICLKRYGMSLPLFRIEEEYRSRGVALSRKTMCNWIIHFGLDIFAPVYDRLVKELKEHCLVQQCDETTWRLVIWPEEDDPEQTKKNGSRGYVWAHTSGEFKEGHRVIVYSFEKTRNAEHLRKYIGRLVMYLVSDAYSGYSALEKERGGLLSVCNCWMHCRRMWAKAVLVMEQGIEEIPVEQLAECMPVRGLLLSNEIFQADTPLKDLPADERKKRRTAEVAPRVETFFEYVHGIDLEDPAVSGKLREAVIYSLNQEKRLRVFLEDGNIPLDNGYVERCIKPVALSRKNSLFSYSILGAECSMIMYSLVETAKANGADVYTYIKYLTNEMPKHQEDTDYTFLEEMLPWSAEYTAYERAEKASHADERVPESNAPPSGVKWKQKHSQSDVA